MYGHDRQVVVQSRPGSVVVVVVRVERVRRDVFAKVRNRLAFGLHYLALGDHCVAFSLDQLAFESDHSTRDRFGRLEHRRHDRFLHSPQIERLCVVRLKKKHATTLNNIIDIVTRCEIDNNSLSFTRRVHPCVHVDVRLTKGSS